MPKIIMSVAIAFLLGVTVVGCAEVSNLRNQLVKDTADLNHKPTAIWQHTADRAGGE